MRKIILFSILLLLPSLAWAGAPSKDNTPASGDIIDPDKYNRNEDVVFNYLQAGVDTYKAGSVDAAAIGANAVGNSELNNSDDFTLSGDNTHSGTVNVTGTLEINATAVTTTAAELNILDGVTGVTYDEIDYLDGVSGTIMAEGDTAGGDLTGTYPNPTIGANKVLSSNINTGFMACFSGVTAHQTNVTLKAGTFTDKWVTFQGYFWAGANEAECDTYVPGGTSDDASLGEGWRTAGEDTTPVFKYNGTNAVALIQDKLSIFQGRFYTESGVAAPAAEAAFNPATPEGLCLKETDAANKFSKDCYLYVDSTSFDLMLHIGTTVEGWVAFSISITVLPDTPL